MSSLCVTPEALANGLPRPINGYLCPPSNAYGIDFTAFTVRDDESGFVYFEVRQDGAPLPFEMLGLEEPRSIRYRFNPDILRLPQINTVLEFRTSQDLPNFQVIEKHYVGETNFATYRFGMDGPLKAGEKHVQEYVYENRISEALITEAVGHPWSHSVEALYFVDDEIVMHNKAAYLYSDDIPGIPGQS